ncbi:MAG: hypothetical protein FJ087_03960 [Deltaproteobacteria bacterium]|nr:hypothetical protein [Deltaproteobacteria bacterium]
MRTLLLATAMALAAAPGCSSSSPSDSDAGVVPDAVGDAATETAADVTPDIDWSKLPRLPADRKFATAYAAGAAERKVTPDHSIYLGGFGFCQSAPNLCRKSQGVHDDLWVYAVVVADTKTGEALAFAGIDSIGILLYDSEVVQEKVRMKLYEKYGVNFEGPRVMVSSSHSHGAPDSCGLWGLGFGEGRDDAYVEYFRDQTVDAIVEAFGRLADVDINWGTDALANSSGDKTARDETVLVLQGKTPAGEPVFTLTRWAAHPTAYGSDNKGLSADWVGVFRAAMAKEYGGIQIYMQGPIGDVYPDRPSECGLTEEWFPDGFRTPGLDPTQYMRTTCTGLTVVEAAKRALGKLVPLAATGIRHRYSKFKFHPENGLLMLLVNATPMPIPQVDVEDPNSVLDAAFGWATLGDLDFLTNPGESFPTFAKSGEDEIRKTGAKNVFTLGMTYDWAGYLLTPGQYKDPDFSYHQTLCPGGELQPRFLEALSAMIAAQ